MERVSVASGQCHNTNIITNSDNAILFNSLQNLMSYGAHLITKCNKTSKVRFLLVLHFQPQNFRVICGEAIWTHSSSLQTIIHVDPKQQTQNSATSPWNSDDNGRRYGTETSVSTLPTILSSVYRRKRNCLKERVLSLWMYQLIAFWKNWQIFIKSCMKVTCSLNTW
jgi:hypothetical protein